MLRARLATAAVAIPLLLFLILYPSPWPLAALVLAIGVIGLSEYAAMAFAQQPREKVLTVALGTLVLAAALYREPAALTAALALLISLTLVWVLFTRPDFEPGLRDAGLALLGILYLAVLLPHFVWLQQVQPDGPRWVVFVVAIAMAGDAAGFFVGKSLGRHKLTPHVSPGKTVEGAVGIVLASLLAGALCKLIFLHAPSYQRVLILSAVMGIIGQLGDLSESVIKRAFATKESGWIFPGHGGVLDRVDSLLFPVALVYYHLLWWR